MMTTQAMKMTDSSDENLVAQSLSGDREAFGQIVARHQSLLCSLAYSATGSLSQSEDLAQETFVVAWKQLSGLREPGKLRSWLCRILRNLTCDAARKHGREPSHCAQSLEEIAESSSPEPLPTEQTMLNEEQAILWRSLERIPEIYREPLILFYRKHQSVEEVAAGLDLSEDAVKQRLSRGRKLLHEQVLAFVEGALERTNPGQAFTIGVVATLPAFTFSAKAAAVGATTATGSATAKTAGAFWLWNVLMGPLIVFVPFYVAYRATLASAQSDEARLHVKALFKKAGITVLALFIPFTVAVLWFSRHETNRSYLTGVFATGLALISVPAMCWAAFSVARRQKQVLSELLVKKYAGAFPKPAFEFCTKTTFLGLPLVHIRIGDQFAFIKKPVKAWVAVGDRAIGGLFAFGSCAIAPVSVGGLAIGVVSLGGLGVGIATLGGIAVGCWALFGGLVIGWQGAVGCVAIAKTAAVGDFALAHDFALGRFASAVNVNNSVAKQFIESNTFFHYADFMNTHWLWLFFFSMVPFVVMGWVAFKNKKQSNRGNLNLFLIVAGLSASLFCMGCNKAGNLDKTSTQKAPNGPADLKLKWALNERIVKDFDMKMSSEFTIPNQPNPIKQEVNLGQEYGLTIVKADPSGGHEVELEFLGARMRIDMGGKTVIDYDSKTPLPKDLRDPTIIGMSKMFQSTLGAKIHVFVDASNEVVRIEGLDDLMKRLKAGGRSDAVNNLKQLYSEGNLKIMVGFDNLPDHPVQPGDTWVVNKEIPMGNFGIMVLNYNFAFQNWEKHGKRTCARLDFTGTIQSKPETNSAAAMAIEGGANSGVSWFDPELGLVIDATANQDMKVIVTMPAKAGGQNMTNTMHQVINVKLASVK